MNSKYLIHFLLGITTCFLFLCLAFFYKPEVEHLVEYAAGIYIEKVEKIKEKESLSVVFLGDVMLSRSVEKYMRKEGANYPFSQIQDFLRAQSIVVGNFEGSIPKVHVPTPSMGFSFSVDSTLLDGLLGSNITYVSLANNHSYDFGEDDYLHTREVLKSSGVSVGGDQHEIESEDVMYIESSDMRIALMPLYAVFSTPSRAAIQKVFDEATTTSDMQIAYIHWGDEYELVHNAAQEELAHYLVDMGVDAVVGHHPHVVQDIEMYKGVPIFYSLGNFIFDQYWEESVRTGLMVRITEESDEMLLYELLPVASASSSPALLPAKERKDFLTNLAKHSKTVKETDMLEGKVRVPMPGLASPSN